MNIYEGCVLPLREAQNQVSGRDLGRDRNMDDCGWEEDSMTMVNNP